MILQTMEWIKGNTTKYRMYGHECMKLEIMVWMNGITIKVWINAWYCKLKKMIRKEYESKIKNLNDIMDCDSLDSL